MTDAFGHAEMALAEERTQTPLLNITWFISAQMILLAFESMKKLDTAEV